MPKPTALRQEIKETLEHFDAEAIINSCINRDRNNIKRYDELLERKELPDSILELLEKQKYQLEWYIKQASQQPKKSPFKEDEDKNDTPPNKENDGGKVINLKAM